MNTNNDRLGSLLERQKRNLTLDTIFALVVAFCLLISIAGLTTTTDKVPTFAAQNQSAEITTACSTLGALSGDKIC
jgi:hypothetical protein